MDTAPAPSDDLLNALDDYARAVGIMGATDEELALAVGAALNAIREARA